ncbi:NAD(P)H-dependent oxidoreductase [Flavobacteriaceae bacterium Ap0902]|nr:NAD(P)H-dependent oxidoreductase [Flavobacteriaceae bacterium Ap0902]
MTENATLTALKWRYATKKFDETRRVPSEKLEMLLEGGNLTATSLGIQPFKMVVVEDPKILKSLEEITFYQSSIQTCSHLLILCAETNVDDAYVDNFIEFVAEARGLEVSALDGYKKMCKTFINGMSEETKREWLKHQCYIVMGNLLTVCASLEIDSCPMEGFNPPALDEVLGLHKHNLKSVLLIPIGYRAEDDKFSIMGKLRKPLEDMVVNIG